MTNLRILVTGASGKTGNAIISALARAKYSVTALTHREKYRAELQAAGAESIVIGDLRDETSVASALKGQDAIYHICPNMTPDEFDLGKSIICLCEKWNVQRFLYHSVLHPQIQSMNHHWQKLLVEEQLFQSSLQYTVIQPAVYMQNWLGYRSAILAGQFSMPYSANACISYLDLRDLGEGVAKVVTDESTVYGVFEFVGTGPITQTRVAEIFSEVLKKEVRTIATDRNEWLENARQSGMPEYTRDTLYAMFAYYDQHGLSGSPITLTHLLGRKPASIEEFVQDVFLPTLD